MDYSNENDEQERQELINRINNKFIRKRKTNIDPEPAIPLIVNELPIELPTYHIPNLNPKTMIESFVSHNDELIEFLQEENIIDDDLISEKESIHTEEEYQKDNGILKKAKTSSYDHSNKEVSIPKQSQSKKETEINPVPSHKIYSSTTKETPVSCNVYIYSLSTVITILVFIILFIIKFIYETRK
jgi:uncharacterized membrane protein